NKKRALAKTNLTVVAPGQWLMELAKASPVFPPQTRFETIHYGLDAERYFPLKKVAAKRELGCLDDRITLVFGAADLNVPRKGIGPLIKALHQVPDPDRYRCLVFGGGNFQDSRFKSLSQKMEIRNLGFLKTVEEKRLVYSAADLFLLPSLEDNQPQTGLESLACGTPVVGFDTGGISEFVQQGTTGLLAKVDDAASLAKQIVWLAQRSDLQTEFGLNGRDLILREFELKKQTRKYLQLYDDLTVENYEFMRDAS
ncbi:MAG: glycosyltransferase, partial [Planctomycetota bacterium]|nr:glycosyltransferase [Planctomycetota bacterium]